MEECGLQLTRRQPQGGHDHRGRKRLHVSRSHWPSQDAAGAGQSRTRRNSACGPGTPRNVTGGKAGWVLPADRQPRGREGAPGLSRWTRPSPCSRQAAPGQRGPRGAAGHQLHTWSAGGVPSSSKKLHFPSLLVPKEAAAWSPEAMTGPGCQFHLGGSPGPRSHPLPLSPAIGPASPCLLGFVLKGMLSVQLRSARAGRAGTG